MKRKKITFAIPLLFMLLLVGCIGKPAQEVNYNQAIGVTEENISSMYVGYRAPTGGWEYNTQDKEQFKMALDFLKNQKYIPKEEPKKQEPVAADIPYRCLIFSIKDSPKEVRIDFGAEAQSTFIAVITSEKFTELGRKFYTLPISTSEKDKQLFDTLKAKNIRKLG